MAGVGTNSGSAFLCSASGRSVKPSTRCTPFRAVAADERCMKRARQPHVIDEAPLPGEKRRILLSLDCSPEPFRSHNFSDELQLRVRQSIITRRPELSWRQPEFLMGSADAR